MACLLELYIDDQHAAHEAEGGARNSRCSKTAR